MFLTNYMKTSMLDTRSLIHRLQELGKPQEDFIYANIQEFKDSELRKGMLKAQDYYHGKHDILEKKRYYIDRNGVKREDTHLSNNKLIHPYFTKLVNQKANYLLGKEFSLQVNEEDVRAKAFVDSCSKYFDKNFMSKLRTTCKQAVINGIAWMQVYYNEKGKLSFKRIPSEEVIAFWHDAEHTVLDGIIRFYTIMEYKPNAEKEEITKIEYFTCEGVWYYEIREGKLVIDENKVTKEQPYRGHFQVNEQDENDNQVVSDLIWDRIPFVAFKYNDEEVSLLNFTKTLIDNYDHTTSQTGDLIADVPNAIRVIRGYGGGDKGEFSQNLATFRNIFVDENGGVEQLTSNADTTCTEAHLTRLKDDIYEAGNGVNVQKENLGSTSGVALKIRYADLDADCIAMGTNFAASIEELCWFIQVDLLNGKQQDINFEEIEFDVIFNTDGIINESDVINDCKNSVGIISDETILANHPWVTDLDKEKDRVEAQKEADLELQQDMFGTDNPNGNDNTGNEEPPTEEE